MVDSVMRIIMVHEPVWWVLENPVGRLNKWLGEPTMRFHPYEYGDPTRRKPVYGVTSTYLKRM